MKKMLIMMIALLGMANVNGQELSVSIGAAFADEHIGENIKSGSAFSAEFDIDLAKESKFNVGPIISAWSLGELKAESETIASDFISGGGLMAGYDLSPTISYKGAFQFPFSKKAEIFEAVISNGLKFKWKEGSNSGFKVDYDYFVNRNIFHYTSQFRAGVYFKF